MDYDNFKKMFPTPIGHQIGDVFIVILWSKWKSNLGKNMEAPDSFKNNPELDLSHYPGASYRALLRGGGTGPGVTPLKVIPDFPSRWESHHKIKNPRAWEALRILD